MAPNATTASTRFLVFPGDVVRTIPASVGNGVSASLPSEVDAQALIGRADAALYRAKEQGRNCVRLAIEAAVA